MESCDVLVVGGGPAGSSCAWKLRQQGLDVLVLDAKDFPRDKVCAGWITPAVLETLGIDPDDYASGRVLQPITGFRTGLIAGPEVETRYGGAVSYGIRRREFDHYLLQRSGARLRLGEPLKSLARRGDVWLANDAIEAPMVIGAGGHFCPVARHLGAELGRSEQAVTAKEIEFPLDEAQRRGCTIRPETPELYFCRDLKGYGWCFRKGDYLNVGLGREDNRGLSEHLEAFCDFLRRAGKIPAIPGRFHGHAYLLYPPTAREVVGDGVLLAGDAAGLAYPQSGEGIRPAIESGLMGAETVIEARGDYRRERLEPYRARLQARFGEVEPAAGGFVPQSIRNYIAAKLLANRWFTRHVVLDRWFLHEGEGILGAA